MMPDSKSTWSEEGAGAKAREGGRGRRASRETPEGIDPGRGAGGEGRTGKKKAGAGFGRRRGPVAALPTPTRPPLLPPPPRRRPQRRGTPAAAAARPLLPSASRAPVFRSSRARERRVPKSELFFVPSSRFQKPRSRTPNKKEGGGGEGKKRKISETLQLTAAGVPSAGTGSGPGTGAPPGSGNTDAAGAMLAMHSSISPAGTCSCSSDSLKCWATVQKCPRWTPRSRMRRSWASAIDLPRYWPGPPKA